MLSTTFAATRLLARSFAPTTATLADRTATRAGQFLAASVAHVGAFPAHVGLVNLDRTREWAAVVLVRPSLPDAMEHEPSGGLAHPNVPMQLHAADRFQAGDFEVDGDRRSMVGMDRAAAQEAFSEFLSNRSLTTPQIRFIEMVIDQLTARGVMEPSRALRGAVQ